MCSICEGTTHDEVLTETRERIERRGFILAGHERTADRPPWLYTIGLVERHNHPELCVLGLPLPRARRVLDIVGQRVLSGERLAGGSTIVVGPARFHVAELDDRVAGGDMLADWHDYYDWQGDLHLRPSALELVRCGRSVRSQPRSPSGNRSSRSARSITAWG
jgi:hypothetical protein